MAIRTQHTDISFTPCLAIVNLSKKGPASEYALRAHSFMFNVLTFQKTIFFEIAVYVYIENVFQDAAEAREQCHQEERSAIRQCTYKNLSDNKDEGGIMVSISFPH